MQIDSINTGSVFAADSQSETTSAQNPLLGKVSQADKRHPLAHIAEPGGFADQPPVKDIVTQVRANSTVSEAATATEPQTLQNLPEPKESPQEVIADLLESGYAFGQRFAQKKKRSNPTEDTDDAIENSDGEDLEAVGNVSNQSMRRTEATHAQGDSVLQR